jgi:hypothetical protein
VRPCFQVRDSDLAVGAKRDCCSHIYRNGIAVDVGVLPCRGGRNVNSAGMWIPWPGGPTASKRKQRYTVEEDCAARPGHKDLWVGGMVLPTWSALFQLFTSMD